MAGVLAALSLYLRYIGGGSPHCYTFKQHKLNKDAARKMYIYEGVRASAFLTTRINFMGSNLVRGVDKRPTKVLFLSLLIHLRFFIDTFLFFIACELSFSSEEFRFIIYWPASNTLARILAGNRIRR